MLTRVKGKRTIPMRRTKRKWIGQWMRRESLLVNSVEGERNRGRKRYQLLEAVEIRYHGNICPAAEHRLVVIKQSVMIVHYLNCNQSKMCLIISKGSRLIETYRAELSSPLKPVFIIKLLLQLK